MKSASFELRFRSGAWTHQPPSASPDHRLLYFDMTVSRGGQPLGGHNVQVGLGAPDYDDGGRATEAALRLDSGWWVRLGNQFAQAPDVALQIIDSVATQLSDVTKQLSDARGEQTDELSDRLRATTFAASGPNYWA